MALIQTAATFRVNHGTLGGWNPGSAGVMQWIRVASLPAVAGWPNSKRLFSKGSVSTGPEFADFGSRVDSLGNISFVRSHYNGGAYSWADYRTNDTPLAATGVDKFVALVYTASGSNRGVIYVGDRETPATACALGTNTDPSGAADDLSGKDWMTGNAATLNEALDAAFSNLIICDFAPTIDEVRECQYSLMPPAGGALLYVPDYGLVDLTTQQDISGNEYDGTTTDATDAEHVPVVPAWQGPQPMADAVFVATRRLTTVLVNRLRPAIFSPGLGF